MIKAELIESLKNRLRKRQRTLSRWAAKEGISCYRVYDAEIPELPLLVDRYEDHLVVAARDGRGFLREHPEPEAAVRFCGEQVAEVLGLEPRNVVSKFRRRAPGGSQYADAGTGSRELVVHEGGSKFLVDLGAHLDTGLFLDHRRTRKLVAEMCTGLDFLNLFAYTASFSVYAAAAGAKSTLSVDLSPRYCEWAQRNLTLNGFENANTLSSADAHVVYADDVLGFVERAILRGRRFDVILVDPPTFSNSKRTPTVFDIERDHAHLLDRVGELLRPQGVLVFSTNKRGFSLSLRVEKRFHCESWTRHTAPFDFVQRNPHQCWLLRERS